MMLEAFIQFFFWKNEKHVDFNRKLFYVYSVIEAQKKFSLLQ